LCEKEIVMNNPELIIGNKNYSSWSLRAWLALRKTGIAFAEKKVALFEPGFREILLAYSPAAKVPIYVDSGFAIWDTLAICEYLAEKHPTLWPAERKSRARARSISAEMHSGFQALRTALPMNCRAVGRRVEITTDIATDIDRVEGIWTDCRKNRRSGHGPWLFGDFSIADAMFAPVASRFRTYDIDCNETATEYMQTVLDDADVRAWYADGVLETEIIEEDEAGAA
jgi:glutathione S-transferase